MPRGRYAQDPALSGKVLDLLSAVFPGFREAVATARAGGLHWEEASTPFVVEEGGRVVAHVGVLEVPLVIEGALHLTAGVHAVATRPECRGRGLMRELTERALEHCEGRYGTVVLTTSDPPLYERFGFRVVPEHRFVCDDPPPAGKETLRPLDLEDGRDLALLLDLLRERAPVSERFGVGAERDVFLFKAARSPLHLCEPLGAVVWAERDGTTLRLHDVVAREMPALAALLSHLDAPVERVEVYFRPDRLEAAFRPEPYLLDGVESLMARGPLAPAGLPVLLPRSARC